MSDLMLSWFERRRQSKTLNLAQTQIVKALGTVRELEHAMTAFINGQVREAATSLERLFDSEIEIDELRRTIYGELTKGALPVQYREDLMALVGRLDRLADHIKDAARSLKILMEANKSIPSVLSAILMTSLSNLVACTVSLRSSMEQLGRNPAQAMAFAKDVEAREGQLDDAHLQVKIALIRHQHQMDPASMLILKDLADAIEYAADMCADTADFIRVLVIQER